MTVPRSSRIARWWRLASFAFGDFAFNLYWQSAMLFLLFYHTETLGLTVETAAFGFLLASAWDGVASLIAGLVADRRPVDRGGAGGRGTRAGPAGFLVWGAVPLGLSFVAAYAPMPVAGAWGIAAVFAAHLAFRTAYAFVNVPYLAMSARVGVETRDRSTIAGMRMLFGTAAGVVVALGTQPIGRLVSGGGMAGTGNAGVSVHVGAAAVFAAVATAILMLVGWRFRDVAGGGEEAAPGAARDPATMAIPVGAALRSLAANRAFVTLALAMMAMIVGITVLNNSVLYYFKYFLRDEGAGQLALASMAAISAVAVPAWMLVSRQVGTRASWLVAAGLGIAGLMVFATRQLASTTAMQGFLVAMQVAVIGLNFAFWAMLPNTIEYGERTTGVRVEGLVFGVAALLQRVAIGLATVAMGVGFGWSGYVANIDQSAATLAGMRWTIALVPLVFLILSVVAMAANPLVRGRHAQLLRELGRG